MTRRVTAREQARHGSGYRKMVARLGAIKPIVDAKGKPKGKRGL